MISRNYHETIVKIVPTSKHRRCKLDGLTGSCKMLQVQSRSPSSSRSNSETCQESSCHLNEMCSGNSFMLQSDRLSEAVADISSSVDNVSDIAGIQGFLITGHLTWTHEWQTLNKEMLHDVPDCMTKHQRSGPTNSWFLIFHAFSGNRHCMAHTVKLWNYSYAKRTCLVAGDE